MSLVLESTVGGDFKPHPEGIHPAVCVDVIDLGMVPTEWQGERRLVQKVKLLFESEELTDEGINCLVGRSFTASLNPKAKLADFLGKWRGRPVVPGDRIDLGKLIGANCTLVISHQQNLAGRTYASIDAISKPTKRLLPSGHYDPALARKRIVEWRSREDRGRMPDGWQAGRGQSEGLRPEAAGQAASSASFQRGGARPQPGGQRSNVVLSPPVVVVSGDPWAEACDPPGGAPTSGPQGVTVPTAQVAAPLPQSSVDDDVPF